MFEACQGIRIYNTQRDSTIPFKLNFSWEYNSAENANPTTNMFYGTIGDLRNLREIPPTSIDGTIYRWDKTFYLKIN
jgi:hypothetical protein